MSDITPPEGVAVRAAREALRQTLEHGDPADAITAQGVTLRDLGEAINGVLPTHLRRRGEVALLVGLVAGRMLAAEALDEPLPIPEDDIVAPPPEPEL